MAEKSPSEQRKFSARLRLFIAFLGAVVKHVWTLVIAFIGSGIFAIPKWVYPFLNKDAQKAMDQINLLPVGVSEDVAIAVLVGGFLLACFFAWEEEHQDADEFRIESRTLLTRLDYPDLDAHLVRYSGVKKDAPLDILLTLEINNKGGQGRVDGWWFGLN